jgi:anti-sigma factor RsiW
MSTTLPEMPCQDLVELITEYLEGGLGPTDRLRFEAHLDECGPCRRYVDQLKGVAAGARKLRLEEIPPATRDALLSAFREWAA